MRPSTSHLAALLLVAAAVLPFAGCQRTIVSSPLQTDYAADDIGAELDFWHQMPTRSAVTNNEALHGLFLLLDGEDKAGNWEARVNLAKSRGWLDADWAEPANQSVSRGTLARAICVACKIDGGVMMRVLGPVPRYAVRELVFLRIMADPSTDYQSLTGLEYIGVVSKAQDYLIMQGRTPAGAVQTGPNA
jgi:hypothetical protein